MSCSALEITNLLYRYAELIDSGQLEQAASLFQHATLKMGHAEDPQSAAAVLAVWRRGVKLYSCGTPRTKHVITNPIVEVEEATHRATCRSYYTVLQATEDFPLQVIAARCSTTGMSPCASPLRPPRWGW